MNSVLSLLRSLVRTDSPNSSPRAPRRREGRRRLGPRRLNVETLEDRTVPASVTVVAIGVTPNNTTTFLSLTAALNAVGNGSTVTIEPGAGAGEVVPTITQSNLTIQGDPNVPSSILPAYDLTINASGVTLTNLNLSGVEVETNNGNTTIARSTVDNLTIQGGATSGNNTISQNYITGEVSIGMSVFNDTTLMEGPNGCVNDQVVNNTFVGYSPGMLSLIQDNNAVVKGNTFTGAGYIQLSGGTSTNPGYIPGEPQVAITIESSQNVLIANNKISLPGNKLPAGATGTFSAISVIPSSVFSLSSPTLPNGPVSTGSILNNVLSAGTTGIGLAISSQANDANPDADTKLLVQGNDFNNDAIGVQYTGSGGTTIGSDLGGGALSSLGGNDFRSFAAAGTSTTGAIVLKGVGSGAVLNAQDNIFGIGVSPSNTVFAAPLPKGSTGTAPSINVGSPLTNNQAFVESLFNNFLGRTGTPTEINGWVNVLTGTGPNSGQAAVVQGVAGSKGALTQIVDGYYLKYLGRVADSGGAAYWVSQIQGGESLEDVQAGFAASPEFISANNSDYVQALYRDFFNRTGSSAELAYWYGQIQQPGGLVIVAQGFANSMENKTTFVEDFFVSYLHKQASSADVTYWVAQGGEENIALSILSSTAYFNLG